jgi:SAM-dependent methyltransferase
MSFEVLAVSRQIDDARAELDRRGWSYRNSRWRESMWRLSRGRIPRVGDAIKSWDVLKTARFALEHLKPNESVLDLGAYSSEVPLCLHAAGFRNIYGIDLNPFVRFMPRSRHIRYLTGSFHATPLASGSVSLVTAISVIEHGYEPDKLLREVARVLRPGGYFVASFDYWPEKLGTEGQKIFGLDWMIFSDDDVRALITRAASHGLKPVGKLEPGANERPAQCNGHRYTFGWLALRKDA